MIDEHIAYNKLIVRYNMPITVLKLDRMILIQ